MTSPVEEKEKWTQTEWDYVPSTEHHGPYVTTLTGDICDCYTMSNPLAASVRNGGESYPINHQAERADANARLIASAPDLYSALKWARSLYRPDDKSDLVIAIDAALSRARGETP